MTIGAEFESVHIARCWRSQAGNASLVRISIGCFGNLAAKLRELDWVGRFMSHWAMARRKSRTIEETTHYSA